MRDRQKSRPLTPADLERFAIEHGVRIDDLWLAIEAGEDETEEAA